MAPQNQPLAGTLASIKWENAWCWHYNKTNPQILDHQYPIVLAYNGIHHYTPTEIISGEDKDRAIYKLIGKLLGGFQIWGWV